MSQNEQLALDLYDKEIAKAAYSLTYRRDGMLVSGELVMSEHALRPRLRALRRSGVKLVAVSCRRASKLLSEC